jgi:hypothetical protein
MTGFNRIGLKDNSITSVVRCVLPAWSFVTTNGNSMYYTNNTTHTVTCCDMNGKVQWEFCDENVLVTPDMQLHMTPVLHNSVMSV